MQSDDHSSPLHLAMLFCMGMSLACCLLGVLADTIFFFVSIQMPDGQPGGPAAVVITTLVFLLPAVLMLLLAFAIKRSMNKEQ
jgi:hypothetical protein